MASRKSSIGAELVIDRRQFTKALAASRGDAAKFAASLEALKMPRGGPLSGGNWTEINSRATATRNIVEQAYEAVSKPAAANVWYEDLKDGLTAVMGSADAAAEHLGRLRLISDDMSLSDDQFEKLVEYSIRLQSLGHSAEYAAEFVREMANAGEGMGRGIEEMEGTLVALDIIQEKGEASMKQIIALSKAVPAFRAVLAAGFGSAAAKDLEALNLSAEELTAGILLGMKTLGTSKPSLSEEGLAVAERKKQTMGADAEDNNGTLAERIALTKEEAAAARAALLESIALRNKAAEAAAKQTKETKAAAKAAEQAAEQLREENAALEEKWASQKQFSQDATGDMEIARLRSRGQTKKADKMEKDREEQRRIQQLMEAGGLSESEAKAMAGKERVIQEDQAYLDRTGKKKMRSQPRQQTTGIQPFADQSLKDEWSFKALANAKDRRNRPLKSAQDRAAGKPAITPDAFNGAGIEQVPEIVALLRAIRDATLGNRGAVADKLQPRRR